MQHEVRLPGKGNLGLIFLTRRTSGILIPENKTCGKILKDSRCTEFGVDGLEARRGAGNEQVGVTSCRSPLPKAFFVRTANNTKIAHIPSRARGIVYHSRVSLAVLSEQDDNRDKQHNLPVSKPDIKGTCQSVHHCCCPHKGSFLEF